MRPLFRRGASDRVLPFRTNVRLPTIRSEPSLHFAVSEDPSRQTSASAFSARVRQLKVGDAISDEREVEWQGAHCCSRFQLRLSRRLGIRSALMFCRLLKCISQKFLVWRSFRVTPLAPKTFMERDRK
jgi:hypothetical protein